MYLGIPKKVDLKAVHSLSVSACSNLVSSAHFQYSSGCFDPQSTIMSTLARYKSAQYEYRYKSATTSRQ